MSTSVYRVDSCLLSTAVYHVSTAVYPVDSRHYTPQISAVYSSLHNLLLRTPVRVDGRLPALPQSTVYHRLPPSTTVYRVDGRQFTPQAQNGPHVRPTAANAGVFGAEQ